MEHCIDCNLLPCSAVCGYLQKTGSCDQPKDNEYALACAELYDCVCDLFCSGVWHLGSGIQSGKLYLFPVLRIRYVQER